MLTNIPVFLDLEAATEGHLAILGMTKMGKTSLLMRIATALGQSRRVVVLDQTGESRTKLGVSAYVTGGEWGTPGVSVLEPTSTAIAADFAFDFLRDVVNKAVAEYVVGPVTKRSVLIDEAHQFVPEPSGLG